MNENVVALFENENLAATSCPLNRPTIRKWRILFAFCQLVSRLLVRRGGSSGQRNKETAMHIQSPDQALSVNDDLTSSGGRGEEPRTSRLSGAGSSG